MKTTRIYKIFYTAILLLFVLKANAQLNVTYEFCLQNRDAVQVALNLKVCNNTGAAIPNYTFKFNWPNVTNVTCWSGLDVVQNGNSGVVELTKQAWGGSLATGCTTFTLAMNYSAGMFPPGTGTLNGQAMTNKVCWLPPTGDNFSCKGQFSPTCFLKTETVDKHTKAAVKEIKLGEGTVYTWNTTRDVYVPTNRVGWAIGMAVAHTMFTNLMGFESMSINEIFATAVQETNCGCDGTITKPAWVTNAYPVNPAVFCSDLTHGVAVGYFQEEFGTGWLEMQADIPCFIPTVDFDKFVVGKNFETQALAKVYHDYNNICFWQSIKCWDPKSFLKNAKDPYATEKLLALSYNRGMNDGAIQNLLVTNRTSALNASDIMPSFGPPLNGVGQKYAEQISRVAAVLDNNFGDVSVTNATANGVTFPGVHKWRDFYDTQVTWTDILNYINTIAPMYAGVGVTAASMIASVQPVFNSINGGNSISYRYDLAPVIDALVLSLPKFDPRQGLMQVYGNSGGNDCNSPSANMLKSDTVCVGQPLTLTVNLTGKGPWSFSYEDNKGHSWTKTGITSSPYVFTVADTGAYHLTSVSDATTTPGEVVCTPVIKAYKTAGAKADLISYGGNACGGKGLKINFTGSGPYDIEYNFGGTLQPAITGITPNPYTLKTAPAPVGTYILTKVTAAGCVVDMQDTVVIASGTPPTATISGGGNICIGDSTQLSVALTGTQPWKIKVNDGTTKSLKSGITTSPYKFWVKTAGTYSIDSVYDASCAAVGTGTAAVVVNALPTIAVSGKTSFCLGDTAKVTITLTGKAPFSITATSGVVPITFTTSLTTYVIPFTMAGTYSINVTDANGCKTSTTVVITTNASPTVNLGNDTTMCFGASKLLDAGANLSTYLWSGAKTGNSRNITADVSGKYKVVVTNANGCKASDSMNVTINSSMVASFSVDTTSICTGTTTNLQLATLSGGTLPYTYQWSLSGNGTTAQYTAGSQGWYKITATEKGGCKVSDSIFVKESSSLALSLIDKTICAGDSIILNSGYSGAGYVFNWNTGETTSSITIKNTGVYGLVVNNNGCSGSDSMQLSQFPVPNINLGVDKEVCAGSTTLLDAGNFNSYVWSSSETTQTVNKGAGTYHVLVTDANGCKDRDTIVVNNIAKPNPSVVADITTCKNTNVTFDVSSFDNGNGPFTYKWNDNSTASTLTLNNVTSNSTYWVDVTDKYGCTGRDSAKVIIQSGLSVVITGAPDTTICAGSSVTLNSNFATANGYNFNWSTGETTESISVNQTQNVTLTVDDGKGCSGSKLVHVKVNALPDMSLIPTTASICSGEAAIIGHDYGAGYTYQWTPNNTGATVGTTVGGTFNIVVTNPNGCKADTDVVVTVHSKPNVLLRDDIDTCDGGFSVIQDLSGQTGVTYNWTKASAANTSLGTSSSLSISTSDTYKLTVTDAFSCSNSDTIKAIFRTTPVVDLYGGLDTAIICAGETQKFDAGNNGMTYLWAPNGETTKTISTSVSGFYAVEVSNGICKDTDAVFVKVITLPTGVLSDTLRANKANYCFNEELNGVDINAIGADGLSYTYLWSPNGETTQSINVKQSGTYGVSISLDKCVVSDKISLIGYCPTSIFIPNSFTPNDDHKNDVFKVSGANVKDFELLIFNRWGEQIFRSTDINQGWDGKVNGNKVQIDVYIWKLTYSENLDTGKTKKHEKLGTVAVIE